MDELTTYAENTWCPGCGNFGLFGAFKKAVLRLGEQGIGRERIVFCTGIGQHAKIFDYLKLSGFYGLHGRGTVAAEGIKMANPGLTVVSFGGDGDTFGEGLAHLMFAAKRNMDITVIVHNNGVYGLTTGQFSPLSPQGYKGPSTPTGSVEHPFNPVRLMLEAGATFVARGFVGQGDHLTDLFVQGMQHKGFAFIDVLQPCITFLNTWQTYKDHTEIMTEPPADYDAALAAARPGDKIPLGIFYRTERPVFHEAMIGDLVPCTANRDRDIRQAKVAGVLAGYA